MRLEIRGTYPPDWKAIARRVKDEAEWRCVRCCHPFAAPTLGSTGGSPLRCDERCDASRCAQLRLGKRLNDGVHHFDGDKSNCAWWNLMALCNACHLSVQARVIPERVWLLEHSAWALPYVAGFYASFYGGLTLTRAAVEEDLPRYLALGQPWRGTFNAGTSQAVRP